MKLFAIKPEIENCLDPETGEFDEARFNELTEERNSKLEYLLKKYRNHVSDAAQLKEQEEIFKKRRQTEENNAESLKRFLCAYLNGEKFSTPEVKATFKSSKAVDCGDEKRFIEWCKNNKREDLLSRKEPTISKNAVKEAIEKGENVPATIVENLNIIIK